MRRHSMVVAVLVVMVAAALFLWDSGRVVEVECNGPGACIPSKHVNPPRFLSEKELAYYAYLVKWRGWSQVYVARTDKGIVYSSSMKGLETSISRLGADAEEIWLGNVTYAAPNKYYYVITWKRVHPEPTPLEQLLEVIAR